MTKKLFGPTCKPAEGQRDRNGIDPPQPSWGCERKERFVCRSRTLFHQSCSVSTVGEGGERGRGKFAMANINNLPIILYADEFEVMFAEERIGNGWFWLVIVLLLIKNVFNVNSLTEQSDRLIGEPNKITEFRLECFHCLPSWLRPPRSLCYCCLQADAPVVRYSLMTSRVSFA